MPVDFPNLRTADQNKAVTKQKIEKEVKLGRYAGPFDQRPLPNLRVSPIGLVPKKTPGEFRLINHLSHPAGYSVNDFISDEACKVEYSSFDRAIDLVARTGRDAELAKEDIKSAFRLLPIAPEDFELLGVKFDGRYYVDKCLPMGIRCAPAYFETFSSFLEHCVREALGTERLIHYMDDFLAVGSPQPGGINCQEIITKLRSVCQELGVPLAEEKSEGPTSKLTFLGLEIDTEVMQVRVPQEKVAALRHKINKALGQRALSLNAIQSIIGSLNFVCRAVKPGRAFLRRLIELTKRPKSKKAISLSEGARADLRIWLSFLEQFNGVTIIQPGLWHPDSDMHLFTDASGRIGFGGYYHGKWFCSPWPHHVLIGDYSIAWKEMVPIVVSVLQWGTELSGKRIMIHTDNMAVKEIINRQTSTCNKIMNLVRKLVLQCLAKDISIRAVHIDTKANAVADSLSRLQMDRFRRLAPEAEEKPTPIPTSLWQT